MFVPPAKSFRRNYKKEYSLSILKYLYCRFPAAQLFSIIRSLTSCTCLVIKRWLKKQLNIKTLTNFRSKSFRLKQPIICDLNHALSSGSREIRRSQQWTKGSCQRESTLHRCPPLLSPCTSDYQLICFAETNFSYTKHLHYRTWLISKIDLGMIGIFSTQLAKSFVKSGRFHYTSLADTHRRSTGGGQSCL